MSQLLRPQLVNTTQALTTNLTILNAKAVRRAFWTAIIGYIPYILVLEVNTFILNVDLVSRLFVDIVNRGVDSG